ncbi:MAG: hypothetical protein ACXADH_06535 [Candidatus Kariarchaeaceae archaeon]|jgi:cytoskeletal protein CcmA (bactofilin family)
MSLEENLKKKLENGEISQEEYDELIKKFSDLDLLSSKIDHKQHKHHRKHKWSFTGSANVEGDDVDGPVRVSGRLSVDGDLKCQSLRVSGASSIHGNLTVLETSKVSGALTVHGDAKFGEAVKSSGKMVVDNNLYLTGPLKISGHVKTGGEIVAGEPIQVSGKVNTQEIRSKSQIKISGKLNVTENVIADELITSGASSSIGGNLQARRVEIAQRYRLQTVQGKEDESMGDPDEIDSLPDLGRFISKMVTKFIPMTISSMGFGGSLGKPGIFEVGGNIEGSEIDISHTHVTGDVVGDQVIVGPEVVIDGVIKYRDTLIIPEESDYRTEKIE